MHKFPAFIAMIFVTVLSTACQIKPVSPIAQEPSQSKNAAQWYGQNTLILVSFDGLRWDYIERFKPPHFLRLASEGVKAATMKPPFPSKTFPSHYSIATGLWTEHHGITGNRFFDPIRNGVYSISDRSAVEDGTWYWGEPIWVTAAKQGMVTASYFFVGSEADIQGMRPTYWKRYDGQIDGNERVDQVLRWLSMPEATRPHMITLYFSEVDSAGHQFGPDSQEVIAAVNQVDRFLGRLLDGIDATGAKNQIDLVLVSDHGMAEAPLNRVYGIDRTLLPPGVELGDLGPYASFTVDSEAPEKLRMARESIASQLPANIPVYLRANVPESLHYKADRRVGDIIVVPPLGVTLADKTRMPDSGYFTHGWAPENKEMHGIFLARGSRIKQGSKMPTIDHVDVYPLMAELLGLSPAKVDGSLAPFKAVLTPAR